MASFRQDAKVLALKKLPLFETLSRPQLVKVARMSEDVDVPAGRVLCTEGSRGEEFFVITEGEARVVRGNRRLATLGAGDFFGEIAVLEPMTRTATVTAVTPLRFFVVTRQSFKHLLDDNPEIERKVLRTLARRLASLSRDPSLG